MTRKSKVSGHRLNERFVDRVKQPGRYGHGRGGNGLSVLVEQRSNGTLSKRWQQRVRINGKPAMLTLGPWPIVTLRDAERAALENARLLFQGADPRGRQTGAPSFAEMTTRTLEWHKGSWAPRTATLWWRAMELHTFPVLGKLPVDSVTSKHVSDLVLRLLNEKSHDTAKRIRQGISVVMKRSIAEGHRADDPAALVKLPKNTKPTKHHRSVEYGEVGAVLTRIWQTRAAEVTKLLIEFGILTTVRPSEAREANWSEVDLQARVWTVVDTRMKQRKAHRIPLSRRAVEILQAAKQLTGDTGLIFESPNGGSLHDDTIRKLLTRHGLDATPHGVQSVNISELGQRIPESPTR